ncbi:hypothetical protein [Salipaludibacillus daqingensis]|uniref:hypothetical protein n=1 Tax=Salipaludibacillus daqingensis TaxID=3041001 RepID=UPI00247627B1|nr:hypothetical protein [Salipaludibacillus daqingensis]
MNTHDMKNHCEQHLHKYVLVTTKDQQQFDAIVESVDDEYVSFAVPIGGKNYGEMMMNNLPNDGGFSYGYGGGMEERQYYPGYGYPYYPQYPPYPLYPYYPPQRFQRLVLPLAALVALSTLPYF